MNRFERALYKAPGLFVTGTDTDIGKTVLAACLTLGLDADYWKPIQSGQDDATDSQRLAQWLDPSRILPERYLLRQPMSPNQAAERDGVTIGLQDFRLPASSRKVIVEGAGGVMVPLNRRHTMLDLMVHLNLPVVLAARSGLGTLNHSLLSLQALRARGLEPLAVVLLGDAHPDNRRDVALFGRIEVLALPWLEPLTASSLTQAFHHLSS